MVPDYHLHTALCKHAHGTTTDFVKAAAERGLPEICFTDHVPTPHDYDSLNRMDLDQFAEYRANVAAAAAQAADMPVLFGIEADYYAGCEQFLAGWLPRQDLDLVLGSVHYIGDWAFDHPDHQARWDGADASTIWRRYFKLVSMLADSGLFDMVGHLDLPKKFGHPAAAGQTSTEAGTALDRVAAAGMGIEINTAGLRYPIAEPYPAPQLLRMARKRDIPICFGSDAHGPENVGADFETAVRMAREAGYTSALRFRKRVPIPYAL